MQSKISVFILLMARETNCSNAILSYILGMTAKKLPRGRYSQYSFYHSIEVTKCKEVGQKNV